MKNIAILAVIFGAFIFTTSCKKIVEPTALNVIENAGTATISGIAYADLDDQDAEPEFAPTGTKVTVAIDQNDFPGASTYNNNPNMLLYTTTVGANGAWTITVKAPKTPINAMVILDPFRATYTDFSGDDTDDLIWSTSDETVAVWEGNTSLVDFWYNF
jgi:hypothetical protein